jgi:hypothetical protein
MADGRWPMAETREKNMTTWKLGIDRKKAARFIKGALLSLPLCGGLTCANTDDAAEACVYDDDCDFGEICENGGNTCPEGAICILAPKPTGQCQPGCWSDDDCEPGEACKGTTGTCPEGAICILAPKAGKCEPV